MISWGTNLELLLLQVDKTTFYRMSLIYTDVNQRLEEKSAFHLQSLALSFHFVFASHHGATLQWKCHVTNRLNFRNINTELSIFSQNNQRSNVMLLIMPKLSEQFIYIKKTMSWVENKIYLVGAYLQRVQTSVHEFVIRLLLQTSHFNRICHSK